MRYIILPIVVIAIAILIPIIVVARLKKANKRRNAAKVLGIISSVVHFLMAVVNIVTMLVGFTAVNDGTLILRWSIYGTAALIVVLFALSILEFILALLSPKRQGCCVALIVIGGLCFYMGIYDIIGGVVALNAHKKSVQSGNNPPVNASNNTQANANGSTAVKYIYPISDFSFKEVAEDLENPREISFQVDGGLVLPLRLRAYFNYGSTLDIETYAVFEIRQKFELPFEKRLLTVKIARDENGKTALCLNFVSLFTDEAYKQRVLNEVSSVFDRLDCEEERVLMGEENGMRYAVDLRITEDEREPKKSEMPPEGVKPTEVEKTAETAVAAEQATPKRKTRVRYRTNKSGVEIFAIVLAALSLTAFVVSIIFLILTVSHVLSTKFGYAVAFGVIACIALGFIAHFIASDPDDGFAYYSTVAQFWVVYFFIWIYKEVMNSSGSGSSSQKSETVYILNVAGIERRLKLVESYVTDYNYSDLRKYNRFIDDIGHYWRSYDGNKTFISEYDLKYGK